MLIWMHKVNYKTFGFNMWGKVWSNKKKPRSNLNFEKKLKQDQSSNCEIKWRSWYRFLALIWCSSGSGWDFSQLIDWNKPSFIFWRTHRDFKSKTFHMFHMMLYWQVLARPLDSRLCLPSRLRKSSYSSPRQKSCSWGDGRFFFWPF